MPQNSKHLLNQATRGCYSTCGEAREKLAFILPPKHPQIKNNLLSESCILNPQQKKRVVTPRSLDLWSCAIPPPLQMPRSSLLRLLLEISHSSLIMFLPLLVYTGVIKSSSAFLCIFLMKHTGTFPDSSGSTHT